MSYTGCQEELYGKNETWSVKNQYDLERQKKKFEKNSLSKETKAKKHTQNRTCLEGRATGRLDETQLRSSQCWTNLAPTCALGPLSGRFWQLLEFLFFLIRLALLEHPVPHCLRSGTWSSYRIANEKTQKWDPVYSLLGGMLINEK